MTIDPGTSLGALAAERPARTELFERLGLDYCCGGGQSIAVACRDAGLDLVEVRALIEANDREENPAPPAAEERDWRAASLTELCQHLVSVHHQRVRDEAPRITELLEAVVRVHGGGRPELEISARAFAALRAELEEHMADEERVLFPACLALDRPARGGGGPGVDPATIDRHLAEHGSVATKLRALRVLGGDYDASQALCRTHHALLEAMRRFEADLHQHVHEENNVLFPRLQALLAAQPSPVPRSRTHQEEPMPTDHELDVRLEPPANRHALIFSSYDELAVGEAFVLVNDHDPKPLEYQFAVEYPAQFTWDYLERGPVVWRVRIGKPAEAAA